MVSARVGTIIALTLFAMRLSETITIYLAAGAPFGVHYYLREQTGARRVEKFLKAACATILWPVAATTTALLFARTSRATRPAQTITEADADGSAQAKQKIEARTRSLLASLYRIEKLARMPVNSAEAVKMDQAVRATRERIESYVGLTLAATSADFDGPPSAREMEICRIAGRSGDNLLIAGRCIHRRNAARLIAHQQRARRELLNNLGAINEHSNGADSATIASADDAQYMSVEIVRFYAHAIDLFSLLEDQSAAVSAASLLDAECARLRRLENFVAEQTHSGAQGDVECKHAHHSAFTGPSQTATILTQG